MEHRAYPRIPLRVDAQLRGAFGKEACVVRDFCLGGVYLTLEGAPALGAGVGDPVQLSFAAPGGEEQQLAARVARTTAEGLGLAFDGPDPAALIALQAAGSASGRGATGPRAWGSGDILEHCAQRAVDHLGPAIREFLSEVDDALVDAASAAPDLFQGRYFDAITALKPRRQQVLEAFTGQVPANLRNLGSFTLDRQRQAAPEESLSLVDQDEFEDFLALSEMAVRAESRLEEALGELERRFSRLCGERVGSASDPLGPAALSQCLLEGLEGFKAHRAALDVVYKTFESHVLGRLSSLYQGLNRDLEAAGISPVEEERPVVVRTPAPERTRSQAPPHSDEGSQTVAPRPSPGHPGEQPAPRGSDGLGAAAGVPPSRPATEPYVSGAGAGGAEEASRRGGESPGAPPGPAAGLEPAPGTGERVQVIEAAYAAAQKLLGLQQQVGVQTGFGPAGPVSDEGAPGAVFGHHDVARALFRLQHNASPIPAGGEGLEALLIQALRREHPNERNATIAPEDREGLRFIAGIIDTLLTDPVVAGVVRERIQRLRLPLQRVAFEDASFLTSDDHPARQVLERLARLDGDEGDTTLGQRLDPLVEGILAEREDLPGAFAQAVPELDDLLEEQQAVYADNVSRLSQECESRERFIRQRRKREGAPEPGTLTQTDENREAFLEWQEWLGRVDRLEPEDSVVLERDSPQPRRARLAWVGQDRDALVFVDGRGRQVANLTPRELAMQLRRGKAEIQRREGPPLMEHAVMEMLHGLHDGLRREALQDPVSGLPHAREFRREVDEALAEAVQERTRHALCHLRVLDLREVRRGHGNEAAQELLRLAAAATADVVGSGDRVGDLGGGSFGVLLRNVDLAHARDVADRLRGPASDETLEWDGAEIPVRMEIGVVGLDASTPNAEAALGAARDAVRHARGGVYVKEADAAVAESPRKSMSDWVPELNRTLREDRLQLRVQKVAPLDTQADARPYYEVFLGLRDETGEPIAPKDFLQAAEYYEQLVNLDRWVIRNVLAWMQTRPEQLAGAAGFAVNLSAPTLADASMADYVTEQLLASEVPPGKLWFEVPHTDTMGTLSNAERFIHTVNGLGCRFALHHFGQSDAQYSFLKDLPVEFVKIDGEFVKNLALNASDLAVVRSVNEIAHMMGKKTIAEYVESEAVFVRLRDMGVNFAQGFYVERPRYIEELGP